MLGIKLLVVLQAAAFWPVLHWYGLRLSDGSDEPWGLLALLTAVYLLFTKANWSQRRMSAGPLVCTVGYILTYGALPPLGRAAWAALAFVTLVTPAFCGRRFHAGLWTLVFLSLPIVPSLQFVFGYPLRVLTAACAAAFLNISGLAVIQEGAMLNFHGRLVWVDAPCSGIKMIWMGSYLTAVLICAANLRGTRAFGLAVFSGAAMFGANVVRTIFLFIFEVFVPAYPQWIHAGVGVAAFFSSASAIYFVSTRLHSLLPIATLRADHSSRFAYTGAIASLFVAGLVPYFSPQRLQAAVNPTTVAWPTEFRGVPLEELPLSEREQFFSRDFPGAIKRFRTGHSELIVRFVNQPTRKLHPATDCLKAAGYRVTPENAQIDSSGEQWSCNIAQKGSAQLRVCELIRAENKQTWPDVSSWYWSAIWRSADGPYWAFTVSEPEAPKKSELLALE